MPKEKSCCCGVRHTRKSAFGTSVDKFFYGEPNPVDCLPFVYNNVTPLTRFGNSKKSSLGPMKIGKI
jgi:hypothetical protein